MLIKSSELGTRAELYTMAENAFLYPKFQRITNAMVFDGNWQVLIIYRGDCFYSLQKLVSRRIVTLPLVEKAFLVLCMKLLKDSWCWRKSACWTLCQFCFVVVQVA